jgi:hypothetical protein
MRAGVAGAFAHALQLCDALAVQSVAVPLLRGGWRVTPTTAMTLMLQQLANATVRHLLVVEVRILNEPGAAAHMRELARSFGLDGD